MQSLLQDFKYAFRALRKTPGFTVVAILTLALGVGASIAVFSVVDAVYFSALPYRDPAALVLLATSHAGPKCKPVCEGGVSAPELQLLTGSTSGGESIAAVDESGGVVFTPDGPRVFYWASVSANFFSVAGLQPLRGRTLIPADDEPGAERAAVISYAFWQDEFGGDTAAIGHELPLVDKSYRIVGIMPRSAAVGRPLWGGDSTRAPFFLPLGPLAQIPTQSFGTVVARLKPGAAAEELRARLEVLAASREPGPREAPLADGTRPRWHAEATGIRESYATAFAGSYTIFLDTVLVVLLIACVNLAGLFLARLTARRREIAVRSALGASRTRLVRQLLTEGLLITGAACIAALVLAEWGVRLSRLLPAGAVPYWTPIGVDVRVAGFALALAVTCALAFGLGPALLLTREASMLAIREVSGAFTGGRAVTATRRMLVSVQIAFALVLVTGAGLLGKTFVDAATRDMGFEKHAVLMGDFVNPRGLWSPAEERVLLDAIMARVRQLPGVEAVGAFAGSAVAGAAGVTREGEAEMVPSSIVPGPALAITPDYFRATGTPMLRGRAFTDADDAAAPPVVIVGDSTARRLYPRGDALGHRIKFGPPESTTPWQTIVGVVRDRHCATTSVTCSYARGLFKPAAQGLSPVQAFNLEIRTRGAPDALIAPVRQVARDLGPTIMIMRLNTIGSYLDRELAPLRVNAAVLGAFAIFALALAALGIYGVLAYLVAQRTTEIGIRMALGATAVDMRRLIFRSVSTMTAAGVIAGAAASLALTRVLRSMLYTTSPTEPRVFVVAALALSATALLAAWLPARRAAGVDPIVALRAE